MTEISEKENDSENRDTYRGHVSTPTQTESKVRYNYSNCKNVKHCIVIEPAVTKPKAHGSTLIDRQSV
jgi:hypothetical protein